MAPSLAHPQRFLVPLYRGDRVGPWRLRAGLQLYDWFAGRAGFAHHSMVRPGEALVLEPSIMDQGLRGAGLYSDAVMDDARLAIAVARDAARHGARIETYTEVIGARPVRDGAVELVTADRLKGGEGSVRARTVINAAGAWADQVRLTLFRSLEPGCRDPEPLLRPSRGIHLVYPKLTRGHGLLLVARSDGRAFFVIPYGKHSLVGTTEVEAPSPPPCSAWRPSLEEVRYVRAEIQRVLPGHAGTPPLAITSGLRPLLRSETDVGSASREHRVVAEGPVFTVAGGKYTTFRVMARDTLRAVAGMMGRGNRPMLDASDPLPAPLSPGATLDRIAEFAVDEEFAKRVEDVIRRRTTLWLEPDRGRVAAPRIAAAMAKKLGWEAERARDEFQSYDAALWDEESLLQRSRVEIGDA
jgi:glycerol-3-phosphate dehydrogenase